MRFGKEFGLGALMLTFASGICSAASTAAVSGVVRDTQGVAQMGARVQVLTAGSVSVATAFTDIYGRYRIANLVPGRYRVRATAALAQPAMRNNLQLSNGMRATVNLTLAMLADPAAWLPAKKREPDEPSDDWTWTLRSAANRPILRLLDDGEIVMVSSGSERGAQGTPTETRIATMGGDGFGEGGEHTVLSVHHENSNGSEVMARAEVGVAGLGHETSTEVGAAYERQPMFGNSSRLVMSYASHPEMASAGNAAGMQVVRMANAEKMRLGDTVDVEAGGTVYAIEMGNTAITAQPFLRVAVHPGEVWAVQYRLATSRDLQGFDGLNSIKSDLPVAALRGGRVCAERGLHQEIAVSRKAGSGEITAAVYRDTIDRSAVAGTGALSAADMLPSGVVVDTATDSFGLLGAGYTASGVRLSLTEPLNSSLWAALEYASGAALATENSGGEGLAAAAAGLHTETAHEIAAELKGRVERSGTKLRASYRWQPERMVTAVAPYDTAGDPAYLSFYVRQAVRWGDKLPQGLEATIDVTNLLAEGYRPFLSADRRTMYLAQSPRTMRAGLSLTF